MIGARSWRLADLDAKHALLAGAGWGNMPEPIVRYDLVAGRLKRLNLPDGPGGFYSLEAIYRTDRPPGPAAAWMIQRFSDQETMSSLSLVSVAKYISPFKLRVFTLVFRAIFLAVYMCIASTYFI